MKYYLHKDTGYFDAYFGNVGTPFEVSKNRYAIAKATGFVATKAPDKMSVGEVHIKAQIEAGSHPTSHKVNELKRRYANAGGDALEPVARAICSACEENPDHCGDARGNDKRWQDYLPVARAAIAAMPNTKHNVA